MLALEKYSIGVGDRFAHQAKAQLKACRRLADEGVEVVPVWNKSNREHKLIGSSPAEVEAAAREAVEASGWQRGWHVDADHIGLDTVDAFLPHADFFTLDVADFIGRPADTGAVDAFLGRHPELVGTVTLQGSGAPAPFECPREEVEKAARQFLLAVQEAGKIYRHIAAAKGEGSFITEVSIDETNTPQTPPELLVILAAIADEGIPAQTIAPKFSGRFNKGIDYIGDPTAFEKEFEDDLAVVDHAIGRYGLPENLKLSVHSGSDKFTLYPIIRKALRRTGAGLHLKTAGTTWLEECIGLAEAGGEGLDLVREIYRDAWANLGQLIEPYATVVDIDQAQLPAPEEVDGWPGEDLASALRHVPDHPAFNPHLRQLVHIAFKYAARQGARYTDLLKAHGETVGRNVTENLYQRHLKPLFLGPAQEGHGAKR